MTATKEWSSHAVGSGGGSGGGGAAATGTIVGLYDLMETLGYGNFACVKKARHVFTGEIVAVKIVDKLRLSDAAKRHLYEELLCLKLLRHRNIVRMYEAIDTNTKLYLVLECADGGDLHSMLASSAHGLPVEQARCYFGQIARAVAYCHSRRIVHRDLKPENVVVFKSTGLVKLTDFGFGSQYKSDGILETPCGTVSYSAPEILLGENYDAQSIDIWSLGVLLYTLTCGTKPFDDDSGDYQSLVKIIECNYTIPAHVPELCADLIRKMLRREPAERIRLQHVVEHLWVTGARRSAGDDDGGGGGGAGGMDVVADDASASPDLLSDEEKDALVKLMVDGGIGERQEILRNIREDTYNHLTATFYLLADRLLAKKRPPPRAENWGHATMAASQPLLAPRPPAPPTPATTQPAAPTRTHGVLLEEDEESGGEEDEGPRGRGGVGGRGGRSGLLSVFSTKSATALLQPPKKPTTATPVLEIQEVGRDLGGRRSSCSLGGGGGIPRHRRSLSSPNVHHPAPSTLATPSSTPTDARDGSVVDTTVYGTTLPSRVSLMTPHGPSGMVMASTANDSRCPLGAPSTVTFDNARKLLMLEPSTTARLLRSSSPAVATTSPKPRKAKQSNLAVQTSLVWPNIDPRRVAAAHKHSRTVGTQTKITGVRLPRLTARSVVDPSIMFTCEPMPPCEACRTAADAAVSTARSTP